jgi:glycosyltransferase involved in cell wall biosynthesis
VTRSTLPKVLIGTLTSDHRGPITTVTEAFIESLAEKYQFVPFYGNRAHGVTRHAMLNVVNIFYLLRHFLSWLYLVIRHRPNIAHYPVTSYWNLEKSLVFLFFASLFGARTVGHLHGGAFVEFYGGLTGVRRHVARKGLQSLDVFVVLSEGWKKRVVEAVPLDPRKVFVVPNPIDRKFEEGVISLSVARTEKKILGMGVIGAHKGVYDLIQSVATLGDMKGWEIDLIGPEREPGVVDQCKRLIADNNLAAVVHMAKGVWGEEKIESFRRSTILVLPSYVENLPLVVLEAAAAGMAIIVTPVGAIPEFFTHGESAWFVAPGDQAGLAEAMRKLMADDQLRYHLGASARLMFKNTLSRRSIILALDAAYRNALEN